MYYNLVIFSDRTSRLIERCLFAIDQEFANYADLQTFFKEFRPDAVGSSFTTVQVNGGGNNQSLPGDEANLDIQYTTSM